MISNGLFSSESVSEGHPDKLADRISDAILDEFLRRDPSARVACETLVSDNFIVVVGEFRARGRIVSEVREIADSVVRGVLRDAGYRSGWIGIDPGYCQIEIRFKSHAADIAEGVDRRDGQLGAGDQGSMFGYACDETPELMPAPILFAHRLMRLQAALRKSGVLPWLRPDAKSQVTFRYRDGRPVGVEAVIVSTQHAEEISSKDMRAAIDEYIIKPVIPQDLRTPQFRSIINPTGRFVLGGPKWDTGLTGRKIVVDTYGGAAPHGGGAFSGKDPSKVDRSAAYMARFLAKQVVARGWAKRCLTQIAYAIGVAEPINFGVDTGETGDLEDEDIAEMLQGEFDLRPAAIIERLDLRRPIYFPTAVYGHFGREEYSWEAVDRPDRA